MRMRTSTPSSMLFLLLGWVAASSVYVSSVAAVEIVNSTAFLTSANSQFNFAIEATAVGDRQGSMYATAFGPISNSKSALGQFAGPGSQQVFYKDPKGASEFNGLRFLPLSRSVSSKYNARSIAADISGHRGLQILRNKKTGETTSSVFCADSRMVQPNDLAIAPRSGLVYFSGANFRNFTGTTIVGDGDLWLCKSKSGSFFKSTLSKELTESVEAMRLGVFGITNGIEVSPDEKVLYLSESFIKEGEGVKVNNILMFSINSLTGNVYNKTLFIDLVAFDGLAIPSQNLIDGMRTDVEGNLFVVRVGEPSEVLKISPRGKVLKRIKTPGISMPSNVDLGGADGKSLYIVGTCTDDETKGCVNVWQNSAPGRAFVNLWASGYF